MTKELTTKLHRDCVEAAKWLKTAMSFNGESRFTPEEMKDIVEFIDEYIDDQDLV